jgi:hypothetical protein
MKKKIGLIFNGVWSQYTFAKAQKYRELYTLIYIHDLSYDLISGFDALVIPFQSNHEVLTLKKDLIYNFLAKGKKVFIEDDSTPGWLDAQWESRPVNNFWWVTDPENPPIAVTDYTHPVYQGLKPRHACWHTHGVYTRIPESARVIQTNHCGEIVTWESHQYGGTLLATTLDPIVEQGIQQITHLDNYCDRLTLWLCGAKPTGVFTVDASDYGVAL